MAGIWGTFEDIKKAVGVVVILLVVSFFLGYISGKNAAKTNRYMQENPCPEGSNNNQNQAPGNRYMR